MDSCHTEALKEVGCSALWRIKPLKSLNLDIQEKSLHQGSFLLWTGCMWRLLFPRKRALGWLCTVGSDIPLSALSWWGCCESFGIALHWSGFFSLSWSVCGHSCIQRWTVGSGWARIYCWEWDTCLLITLGVFEQPFLVQKDEFKFVVSPQDWKLVNTGSLPGLPLMLPGCVTSDKSSHSTVGWLHLCKTAEHGTTSELCLLIVVCPSFQQAWESLDRKAASPWFCCSYKLNWPLLCSVLLTLCLRSLFRMDVDGSVVSTPVCSWPNPAPHIVLVMILIHWFCCACMGLLL